MQHALCTKCTRALTVESRALTVESVWQIKCARTPATCKWKGYYAAEDARNWTEELREGLGYTTQEQIHKISKALSAVP